MLPFERLAYFIGIAVALTAWGGNQLVERILSSPTILLNVEATLFDASEASAHGRLVAKLDNLSRSHSHSNIVLAVQAPSVETIILSEGLRFGTVAPAWSGRELPIFVSYLDDEEPEAVDASPALPHRSSSVDFPIARLDPGASYEVAVPFNGTQLPKVYVRSDINPIRIINPSLESFLIKNQFEWILFIIGASVSFSFLITVLMHTRLIFVLASSISFLITNLSQIWSEKRKKKRE